MGNYNIINVALYTAVFAILAAAAIIDIRKHIIPDKLVFAGAAAGFIIKLLYSKDGFVDGLMGSMTAGLILLLVYRITKGGLGLGDVKLFGCIGIYLGLENTFSAMLMAAMSCGFFSLVLICLDRNNRKREIPFAPFILVGTLAAVLL